MHVNQGKGMVAREWNESQKVKGCKVSRRKETLKGKLVAVDLHAASTPLNFSELIL